MVAFDIYTGTKVSEKDIMIYREYCETPQDNQIGTDQLIAFMKNIGTQEECIGLILTMLELGPMGADADDFEDGFGNKSL